MCWWVFHNWTQWLRVSEGALGESPSILERSYGATEPRIIGHWLRQERRCADCGLVQQRVDRNFN